MKPFQEFACRGAEAGSNGQSAAATTPSRQRMSAKQRRSPASNPSNTGSTARPLPASKQGSKPPAGVPEKLGDRPLRLILLGHNPSEHAWQTGHYYSNPSNRMWPILIKTGIAPPEVKGPEGDDLMPTAVGVGFTDVGSGVPGTDSSKFKTQDFQQWQQGFYQRLRNHMQQVSDRIGCVCGTCGAPSLVAFTGKRQYQELLKLDQHGRLLTKQQLRARQQQHEQQPAGSAATTTPSWSRKRAAEDADAGHPQQLQDFGRGVAGQEVPPTPNTPAGRSTPTTDTAQAAAPSPGSSPATTSSSIPFGPQTLLPAGWPLPLSTEVWVLTSTSGACPLTHQQREGPYQQLAARLQQILWPRLDVPRCKLPMTPRQGQLPAL